MKPLPLSHCIDLKTMKLVADEPVVWEVLNEDGDCVLYSTNDPIKVGQSVYPYRFRTASSPHLWQVADGKIVRSLGVGEVLQEGDEFLPWRYDSFGWGYISPGMVGYILKGNHVSLFRRPFSSQETQPKGQVKTCATQNAVAPATDSQSSVQSTEAKPVASNGGGEVPAFPSANASQGVHAEWEAVACPAHRDTARQLDPMCPICLLREVNQLKAKLASQGAEVTDSAMLDWLETQQGAALVSDDDERWAVSYTGFQNVPMGKPIDVETTFLIAADEWKPTLRSAITAAMKQPRQSHE